MHFCHQEPLIWNLVLSLLHHSFKNISLRVWRRLKYTSVTSLDADLRKWKAAIYLRNGRRFEDWTSIRDWTSIWVTYILGTVTIPRPHDLVNCYGISVSQITTYIFRCSNPNPILSLFMTWVCNTRSVTCGVWLPFRRTSDYSQCRLKFMFRGVSHVESDMPTLPENIILPPVYI